MIVLVANDESRIVGGANDVEARLANSVTWLPQGTRRLIIAVDTPSQWQSSQPLPPTAVSTDPVSAALGHKELADELWGAFLSYLVYMTKPSIWRRNAMIWLPGVVPVRLELLSGPANEAVARSIRASPLGKKFRIINAA
jgi:hypothetical protein